MIPRCEGRNDLFSAIWTHWPRAPSTVVYDAACLLMSYSIRCEPRYFKNTKFLVDRFHWFNHKKCSRASALKTYMNGGERALNRMNDSVAESCNALLKKLRVSVSYMTKYLCMPFMKIFMHIANRKRAHGLEDLARQVASADKL